MGRNPPPTYPPPQDYAPPPPKREASESTGFCVTGVEWSAERDELPEITMTMKGMGETPFDAELLSSGKLLKIVEAGAAKVLPTEGAYVDMQWLDVGDGEVLVLSVKEHLSAAAKAHLCAAWQEQMPGAKAVILDGGVTLSRFKGGDWPGEITVSDCGRYYEPVKGAEPAKTTQSSWFRAAGGIRKGGSRIRSWPDRHPHAFGALVPLVLVGISVVLWICVL